MRISLPLGHVCSKICLATCLKLAKGQKLNRARQIISQKDPIIIFIESLLRTGRYLTCVISKHHDNPETEPSNFIGGKTENKRGWVTGPMVHSCKWQSQDKIQVCLRSSGTISCLMSMTSKFGIFVQILVHKLYFIKDVFGVNPAGCAGESPADGKAGLVPQGPSHFGIILRWPDLARASLASLCWWQRVCWVTGSTVMAGRCAFLRSQTLQE